jgi:ubiquinone/menaquinone biosynthesis C-methylase UbiE
MLDVGTGTGVFLPFLLSSLGRGGQIIALDIAEAMLEIAKAKGFNGEIDYINADVTNLPLCNETFDVVVCYSSFPHFQDKPRALTEIKRVLKGGGRLLICHTSGRAQINQIHRQIPVVANDLIPDEREMLMMLSMAGFIDIKIEDNRDDYLASGGKLRREVKDWQETLLPEV